MRRFNNHKSAASTTPTLPFTGMGFVMESVRAAAQEMTVIPSHHDDETRIFQPVPECVTQPSGYSLLVALGREIRGR